MYVSVKEAGKQLIINHTGSFIECSFYARTHFYQIFVIFPFAINSSRSGVAFWLHRSAEIGLFIYHLFANRLNAIFVTSISLPHPCYIFISPKPIDYRIFSGACSWFLGSKICYLSHWTPWFIEFLTKTKLTKERVKKNRCPKILALKWLFVAFTVGWTICFFFSPVWSFVRSYMHSTPHS